MAIRKWYGAFVAGGLVGLIAAGCSSSNESAATDAGDGGFVRKMLDGAIGIGTGDDAGDAGGGVVDGTTGKKCSSDSDCHPDGGAGVNMCSVDVGGTITGVTVQLWATPVCLVPPSGSSAQGNCDPVPQGVDDGLPHFCDGPDLATSPGLCLPFDLNNPQPGQGTCYPLCTFVLDGSKPAGCVGTDTCLPVSFVRDGTTRRNHRIRILRRRLPARLGLHGAGRRLRLPDGHRLLHEDEAHAHQGHRCSMQGGHDARLAR